MAFPKNEKQKSLGTSKKFYISFRICHLLSVLCVGCSISVYMKLSKTLNEVANVCPAKTRASNGFDKHMYKVNLYF